ncbi:MAG: hypothetical protein HWN68_06410 [Desulfobacterales bacterium]|nr:hypothetical protein [Desulfobacterales bacterium]
MKDIIKTILEDLSDQEIVRRRIDGEFEWDGKIWKYSAYKVSQPVEIIRIDIKEKGFKKTF